MQATQKTSRLQQLRAACACAHGGNSMTDSLAAFSQVHVCKAGHPSLRVLRVNIPLKPIMGKFCILFHPLPAPNNTQGNVIQNETCHLPTSRGGATNTLDQFSSPVLLQPPTPQSSPGTRAVMMHSGAGRAGQGCSPSCCFKPEGKCTGKRPQKKAWCAHT